MESANFQMPVFEGEKGAQGQRYLTTKFPREFGQIAKYLKIIEPSMMIHLTI